MRDNEAAEAVVLPWWHELQDGPGDLAVRFALCSAVVGAQTRRGVNDWTLMEAQVRLGRAER